MPRTEMRRDLPGGGANKAHVRFLIRGEGRGNADEDDIGLRQGRVVLRGAEPPGCNRAGNAVGREIGNHLRPLHDPRDPLRIEVNTGHIEPRIMRGQGQGQPDIAKTHNRNPRLARYDAPANRKVL